MPTRRRSRYAGTMIEIRLATELQLTIAVSTHDKHWLAQKLYDQPLHTWQATARGAVP
jgi:hypothetical protein